MPKRLSEDFLVASAKSRTERVRVAMEKTKRVIEKEIDDAGGLYPYNSGRLTQAEVCRRARVSKMTLHAPSHRETTRKDVDEWIKRVSSATAKGRRTVRRAVDERAAFWKEAHHKLATARHIEALEVIRLKSALAEALEKISVLESDCAALLRQARQSPAVVPIRATAKKR